MLNYAKIKDKSRIFRSFTGLTVPAFSHLLNAFGQAEEQAWQQQKPTSLAPPAPTRADANPPW
jgi:hypothetical protein